MDSNSPEQVQNKIIGWREWVGLPGLNIRRIKAKIDSGARSSSLHAFDIEEYTADGQQFVKFKVYTRQRTGSFVVESSARVVEFREIKSSSGHVTERPVILTEVEILDRKWPIELTLADRNQMGFRMLLGREAIRGKFLIDSDLSYCGGKRRKLTSKFKRRES